MILLILKGSKQKNKQKNQLGELANKRGEEEISFRVSIIKMLENACSIVNPCNKI